MKKKFGVISLAALLMLSAIGVYASTATAVKEYYINTGSLNGHGYVCQAIGNYVQVTARTTYYTSPASRSASITGYYLGEDLQLKAISTGDGSATDTTVEVSVTLPSNGVCFTKLCSYHTVEGNSYSSGTIEMTVE